MVVMVAMPEEVGLICETVGPKPNFLTAISAVSLVMLFLRSLVTTSPRGALLANVVADFGFSSGLSLSN